MKFNLNYTLLGAALLAAVSCTYEFPDTTVAPPDSGDVDLSRIINVGNSLTAGFMDGALYTRGQQNSFSVILAEQSIAVGGRSARLPDINSENGFFGLGPGGQPLGRLVLQTNPQTGAPAPAPIGPGDIPAPFTGDRADLDNFGVPGITLGTALTPLLGGPASPENPAFNPLYARFASAPGQSTVIGDAAAALASGGTFFTFWLGNNDVLGYATGGAANPAILTSDADFQMRLNAALGALLQANPAAKGAVANIPNLDVLPFFNLVPWNALPLDGPTAAFVTSQFSDYNNALLAFQAQGVITAAERELRTIRFVAGQNGFLMEDRFLTDLSSFGLPSIRQSNATDKPVLQLSTALGQPVNNNPQLVRGVSFPVEDSFVLTRIEQEEVQTKINTFNGLLAAAVTAQNDRLVLVDVNNLLTRTLNGQVSAGNIPLTASITPPNGGFSLDGVHPNARAHAFVANEFIRAINQKWGATIPLANPNEFMGNDLPQ